jgi:hypothetical protein
MPAADSARRPDASRRRLRKRAHIPPRARFRTVRRERRRRGTRPGIMSPCDANRGAARPAAGGRRQVTEATGADLRRIGSGAAASANLNR